jgi:predicted nucleic acid-binding protein
VKVLFDTSVLVAALVEDHAEHARAFSRLKRVHEGEIQGAIGVHAIAEFYAVVTRLPFANPPIPPARVADNINTDIVPFFEVVELVREDYQTVVSTLVTARFLGGAIFDALIAQSAV